MGGLPANGNCGFADALRIYSRAVGGAGAVLRPKARKRVAGVQQKIGGTVDLSAAGR